MKLYAFVVDGKVQEIILPMIYDAEHPDWRNDLPSRIGLEIPIEERYHPELVAHMYDITDMNPIPVVGWTHIDGIFEAPIPYSPSASEILEENTLTRDVLMTQAGLAIAPLQDAVDLGDATAGETAQLTKWKQYRVAVNRINLALANPEWPATPK
jgi:hypothetical protein